MSEDNVQTVKAVGLDIPFLDILALTFKSAVAGILVLAIPAWMITLIVALIIA